MIAPDQTAARLLETSFRDVFASSRWLAGWIREGALTVYTQNEDLPADPDKLKLPALILAGQVKGWDLAMRVNGVYAQSCALRIQCRVAGNRSQSAPVVERLASDARNAVETATRIRGWKYLRLELSGDERGFDRGARVVTPIYELTCLPA